MAAADRVWIWKADSGDSHEGVAVVLTTDRLLHRKLSRKKDLEAFAKDLEAGVPPEEVLGKKATVVELRVVRRLRVIGEDDELTIDYGSGRKRKRLVIGEDEADPYREIFDALRNRVAPGVVPYPTTMSWREAARKPAVGLLLTLLIGGLALGAHFALEAGWDPGGLKGRVLRWVLQLLGLTGIVVVQSIVALTMVWWLVARTREPPRVEEIILP